VIRVLLVDDQALVRGGFAMLLSESEDLEIVGEAGDGVEALELVRRTAPDLVLMDIRMPRMDGIEATRRISADPANRNVKVLILTTFDDDDLVYAALHAGASGFLLKETRPTELLAAINTIVSGEALLSPKVTRRLIEQFTALTAPPGKSGAQHANLTDREREVLVAVAAGRSNQEIAQLLAMGYGTVKTHVSHLLTKLNCRDRAQLVAFAYEQRIAVPGNGRMGS
jgi:DNA-binding NarL/FixJ family response regulator